MKQRDLFDIITEPHDLYHISPRKFDFPTRDAINGAREWSRWHANGVLGLWCSTFPARCAPFGKHIYKIVLKPGAIVKGLPFGVLYKTTSGLEGIENYQPIIDEMCAATDVLYIVDNLPMVGEVIIMNFDAIESFEEVETAEDVEVSLRRKT